MCLHVLLGCFLLNVPLLTSLALEQQSTQTVPLMLLQLGELYAALQTDLAFPLITLVFFLNVLLEQVLTVTPDEADPTSNGSFLGMTFIIVLPQQRLARSLMITVLASNFEFLQPMGRLRWFRVGGHMFLEALEAHDYHFADGTLPLLVDRFSLHVLLQPDTRFELPTADVTFRSAVLLRSGMRQDVLF